MPCKGRVLERVHAPKRYRMWDPTGYILSSLYALVASSVVALEVKPGARVLDFGCGHMPYKSLFGEDVEYIGADLPGAETADLEIIDGVVDLPDESVDIVLSTQVLEHVTDPQAYLAECHRVLRPGGKLLLTTHGVMFYHPHPGDYWRWTTDGLRAIVRGARMETTSITPLLGAVPLGLWLIMINLQARLPFGIRQVFVSMFNLLIWWTDRFHWNAYRADFSYIVVAERPQLEPADWMSA